ncbi:prevent-host-death family protein [Mycobacterium decipiens]|uniref:Antitoxin n=1 Tax=Mycobacterium decipiens TaxID=1430326 RepID=A0A1X2LYI6_9MYCO|nr:prevent-host-death family protein [Mycobacterium decipiens]
MTATEVKAKILALLDEVAAGEEIEITKHGRAIARLVAATGSHALKGRMSGMAMTAVDEDHLFTTGASWNASRRRCCSTRTWCTGGRPNPSV